MLAVDAIISVDPGAHMKAGDVIARIPPRAPRPATSPAVCRGWRSCSRRGGRRSPRSSQRLPAPIRFGKDYKNKRRVIIEPSAKDEEPKEYLIPKGKHIHLQEGDVVEKGDFIVEGNPAPHDILAIKGVEDLAAYLVNEIQDVYRLQGVRSTTSTSR